MADADTFTDLAAQTRVTMPPDVFAQLPPDRQQAVLDWLTEYEARTEWDTMSQAPDELAPYVPR